MSWTFLNVTTTTAPYVWHNREPATCLVPNAKLEVAPQATDHKVNAQALYQQTTLISKPFYSHAQIK